MGQVFCCVCFTSKDGTQGPGLLLLCLFYLKRWNTWARFFVVVFVLSQKMEHMGRFVVVLVFVLPPKMEHTGHVVLLLCLFYLKRWIQLEQNLVACLVLEEERGEHLVCPAGDLHQVVGVIKSLHGKEHMLHSPSTRRVSPELGKTLHKYTHPQAHPPPFHPPSHPLHLTKFLPLHCTYLIPSYISLPLPQIPLPPHHSILQYSTPPIPSHKKSLPPIPQHSIPPLHLTKSPPPHSTHLIPS